MRPPSTSEPRTLDAYYYGALAGQIVERHLGTTNVLWCDGHVKAMKLDNLYRIVPNTSNEKILTYFTCKADPD